MRVRQGHDAGLITIYKLRHVPGISGGLREQRKELGKQISGAMPEFADHQFVALLQLAALNGAGHEVGDGGKERTVLLAEVSLLAGADAENAVSPAVTAGDNDAHAADTAVTAKVLWGRKSRLSGKICGNHRDCDTQNMPRIAVVFFRHHDRANKVFLPAKTGAQQKIIVARHELQDFDEVDR